MEGSLEREEIRTRMICDTMGTIVGTIAEGLDGKRERGKERVYDGDLTRLKKLVRFLGTVVFHNIVEDSGQRTEDTGQRAEGRGQRRVRS